MANGNANGNLPGPGGPDHQDDDIDVGVPLPPGPLQPNPVNPLPAPLGGEQSDRERLQQALDQNAALRRHKQEELQVLERLSRELNRCFPDLAGAPTQGPAGPPSPPPDDGAAGVGQANDAN